MEIKVIWKYNIDSYDLPMSRLRLLTNLIKYCLATQHILVPRLATYESRGEQPNILTRDYYLWLQKYQIEYRTDVYYVF